MWSEAAAVLASSEQRKTRNNSVTASGQWFELGTFRIKITSVVTGTNFPDVMPCSLVNTDECSAGNYWLRIKGRTILLPWQWRQQVSSKRWYLSTKLHDGLSSGINIFEIKRARFHIMLHTGITRNKRRGSYVGCLCRRVLPIRE